MKLQVITTIAANVAFAISLSACAGLPGTGGGSDWAKAAVEIAKDPSCGHVDILDIMLGPVPSGHVHLERSGCKTAAAPKKAATESAAPLAVGEVVAPN